MKHWDALREAIKARGLWHLVAENGQQAVEHMVRDIQDENTILDFEPLMGSAMTISRLAMNVGGLAVLAPNEDGTMPCPVCFLQQFDYIAAAADGAKAYAVEKGLVEPE